MSVWRLNQENDGPTVGSNDLFKIELNKCNSVSPINLIMINVGSQCATIYESLCYYITHVQILPFRFSLSCLSSSSIPEVCFGVSWLPLSHSGLWCTTKEQINLYWRCTIISGCFTMRERTTTDKTTTSNDLWETFANIDLIHILYNVIDLRNKVRCLWVFRTLDIFLF